MQYKDYYQMLGIPRTAGSEEIQRAYRKLAHKYHPDVSSEPDAEARFKEVNEAGEVLRDAEKRKAYDQWGDPWQAANRNAHDFGFGGSGEAFSDHPGAENLNGFSDFFDTLFSKSGPYREASGETRYRGSDQHATLHLSLEEAYTGGEKAVTLELPSEDAIGNSATERRVLRVQIPPGVEDGRKIRLRGQGLNGYPGGSRGDLYLTIRIRSHPHFSSQGKDILLDLPVTPWEAAMGTEIAVPTLGGRVKLKIPAGSQTGSKLRLKGRGLPGTTPGDQFVMLKIMIPEVDSARLRQLYTEMQQSVDYNPRSGLGV